MRRSSIALAFLCTAVPLGAQTAPTPRALSVTPASSLHGGWMQPGSESSNGRFVVAAGSTLGDSGFVRYDRTTKSWGRLVGTPDGNRPQWSPDGRFLAYSYRADGQRGQFVWVIPIDTATGLTRGTPRRVSTRAGGPPSWSPDGRRIAFASNDASGVSIVIIPFNGGDEQVVHQTPGRTVDGTVVWSPDGRYVYLTINPPAKLPHFVRVNVATKRADMYQGGFGLFAVSGDGKLLALHNRSIPYVVIASAENGQVLERYYVPPGVIPIGWSRSAPNEMLALEHVVPTTIQRASLPDGALRALTPVDSMVLANPSYSPDGRSIAYSRLRGGASQIVVINADGSNPRYLGEAGGVGGISWSPSGREIAYTSGKSTTLRAVDVTSGKDREIARNVVEVQQVISWRSDGLAIRYLHWRQTPAALVRDVREVSMDGKDRLLATVATATQPPKFVNDTLLVFLEPNTLRAINVKTSASRVLYSGPVRVNGGDLSISADGNWLALVAPGENDVPLLVSLKTGESRKIPYTIGGEISNAYLHPDGKTLVVSACPTCNTGAEKWDIVLVPMNGDPPRVLTPREQFADTERPSIAPDGKSVVFYLESAYYTRIATIKLSRP